MLTCITLCSGYICFIPLRKSLYFICFLLVLSAIFPMPHSVSSSRSHSFFYITDGLVDLICTVFWRFWEIERSVPHDLSLTIIYHCWWRSLFVPWFGVLLLLLLLLRDRHHRYDNINNNCIYYYGLKKSLPPILHARSRCSAKTESIDKSW